MLIKCTMREGITEADIEGFRYTFRPDKDGNPLCSVTKEGHIEELLKMGPHCYVEFKPERPVEQMSAKEILEAPGGKYESEKARIREEIAKADKIEASKKAQASQSPEARQADLEKRVDKLENDPAAFNKSASVIMAEKNIKALIGSFQKLSKPKFREWIEINRDAIGTMPPDVKAAVAKKILAKFKDQDPEIDGLDLEKYAKSTDATNKGHRNIK